ncbi:MAG: hypothetical protein HY880_08735, partial [Deltaproteobacteria bacterium]|nr:hypothetical protein [Deltaproteobacteria bacterium]
MRKGLAIFALTQRGLALARRLKRSSGGTTIHAPQGLKNGKLKDKVRAAFKDSNGIVFVSAVGIAVRIIAPLLRSKATDPAIVVMDETGRFAISLVSGHLGGANELTKKLARIAGARPVITTATDLYSLPSIEAIAKKFNLAIEDMKRIKHVNSAIINNKKVFVNDGNAKRLALMKKAFPRGAFEFRKTLPRRADKGSALVVVSTAAENTGLSKKT